MATLYTLDAVNEMVDYYADHDGEIIELIPGTLGYGTTVCRAAGLKTAIIQERYINDWASAHTIRLYNVCPKKYEKMIEDYYDHADDYQDWIQEKLGIA